jgi:hypothetical protein
MVLDQFDNPAKARLHVGRQSVDLISNAGVENFNDPSHASMVLHFCDTHTSLFPNVGTGTKPDFVRVGKPLRTLASRMKRF